MAVNADTEFAQMFDGKPGTGFRVSEQNLILRNYFKFETEVVARKCTGTRWLRRRSSATLSGGVCKFTFVSENDSAPAAKVS